jgi:hypothetical protein
MLKLVGQIFSSCLNGETFATVPNFQPDDIELLPPQINVFKNINKTQNWYLAFWATLQAHPTWTQANAATSDFDHGLSPINFQV